MTKEEEYLKNVGQSLAKLEDELKTRSAQLEETIGKIKNLIKNERKKIESISRARTNSQAGGKSHVQTPG